MAAVQTRFVERKLTPDQREDAKVHLRQMKKTLARPE